MIRSLVFTTQGRLHSKDIEMFLMPTLLSDTNLFLWVDLEKPTPEEAKFVLDEVFHFHPLSIEDCITVSPSPKVEEYSLKEGDKFSPYLVPHYRNVYDALFQIFELAQSYTDSLTGLLQIYLNMSSNQTGEVVKLLTLITLITTPMTLVGTCYGMNFAKTMPEYKWKHGYLFAIIVTILSSVATYWWFKKKKWF